MTIASRYYMNAVKLDTGILNYDTMQSRHNVKYDFNCLSDNLSVRYSQKGILLETPTISRKIHTCRSVFSLP